MKKLAWGATGRKFKSSHPDSFTNFSGAIHSYPIYFQKTTQYAIDFTKRFPLLTAYEGSGYAQALSLIQSIPSTTGNISLKKWTAEEKVSHSLRPLVLDTCCVPLLSEEDSFVQRQ